MLSKVLLSLLVAAGPVPADPPSWQPIRIHDYGGCDAMTHIVAVSHDDVWAFGHTDAVDDECGDGGAHPVAQHWDGSAWRTARLPGHIYGNVSAVGASSSADVWAFTSNDVGTYYALHFDGTRWKDTGQRDISGAVVLGRHHVWGYGTRTKFWNGYAWRTVSPVRPAPYVVSVVSGADAWGITGPDTLSHFDGRSWKKVALGSAMPADTDHRLLELTDVLAVSENDVWLFAERLPDDLPEQGAIPLAAHFDGRAWSRVALPELRVWRLRAAASDGAGGIHVIADRPGEDVSSAILSRSAAGRWSVRTPQAGGKRVELRDLVRIPGTKEVWAVGAVREGEMNTSSAVFALG
ncbi:hypothetical protein [Nonomuraea sp. NPDC049695]|uniref:hypothetical protein n=1 Tax=Nonomuraea sp. NPDC049695 TaxID=3154734 RepID=UPI0034321792